MKLGKTAFYSALITVIKTLAGFISTKVVAMFLGPAGLALVGQFINFLNITFTFANGAVNTGVVKYTAEFDAENDAENLKKLYSTSLKITLFFSVIISILLIGFPNIIGSIVFKTTEYSNPIRVTGLGTTFYALNLLLISIINGRKEIKLYTKVNIIGTLVGLLLTVVLIYFYKSSGALYALSVSQSIVFLITILLLRKEKHFKKWYFTSSFDKGIAKKLSSFSLMAIVSAITMPVAQIYLRNYVSEHFDAVSAGYWQGLMRVSDTYLLIIVTALSTYYLPKLSSIKENGELRKEIFAGYKLIIPFVLVSCFVIFLLRDFIIQVLYTQDFQPMRDLFFYQLLGDIFKIAAWIPAYLMLAKAMTKKYIVTEILFTVSYVFISQVCMSVYGLQGIVIGFALNYFCCFIFMIFLFRNLLFKK